MDSVHDFPELAMPCPNLDELRAELGSRGYTNLATGSILGYADTLGTLEGCIWVDPEDRAAFDAILEDAWPAEPSVSHRWDDDTWQGSPSRWTLPRGELVAALAERFTATLSPDDEAEEDTVRAILERWELEHELATRRAEAECPPIEPDDYVPSEEDEAIYAAWLADHEPLTLDPEPFHP